MKSDNRKGNDDVIICMVTQASKSGEKIIVLLDSDDK